MCVCNELKGDSSARVDGKTRSDECESKHTPPVSGAANKEERSGEEPMVINMLLCYVQCHMDRTVKTNIMECVSRYFSFFFLFFWYNRFILPFVQQLRYAG